MKYKVTMICREISRVEVIVDTTKHPSFLEAGDFDLEAVKDVAWAQFDANVSGDLEQENFTKVEVLQENP